MYESMVFYRSFYEAIKDLPDDVQGRICNAIMKYGLDGEEPALEGVEKSIFVLIKPQIDANNRRKETGKENGRKGGEFGNLGGRPKKENPEETPKKPPKNPQKTPNEPVSDEKKPSNANVNVNVNANVGINSESIYKDSHARAREDNPTMSTVPEAVQPPSTEVKRYNRYGLFNNVLLTDREFTQLRLTYKDYKDKIENLSSYMQQNGKMYADHYATICKWAREDAQKARSGTTKTADMLDEFYDMTDNWAQSRDREEMQKA